MLRSIVAVLTACALLVVISPAPAAAPDVPPLLPHETPPTETPNYFEPREMSAGGVVTSLDSCQSAAHKADPTISDAKVSSYCTCATDAMRSNFRASGDVTKATPVVSQLQRCGAAARTGAPSPFAIASPRSTPEVWKAWLGCVRVYGDKDHGIYCDCFVDANLAAMRNPAGQLISPADQARCEIADRYWAATKRHLTVRQFKALTP
jgi:hypothetical protein